ncbi:MAG: hypothetical protein IMX02_01135 [Limnochordaceae bacterium]|nr:hypothetical protein [Limnochordaceae bacterium]
MQWDQAQEEPTGRAELPTVVLRGMGWRMVAMYLTKLGGEVMTPDPLGSAQSLASGSGALSERPVLAEVSGKGWKARLHEEVEFTGALRSNRVEVRLFGEPDAVEHVLTGLRRMALMEEA